MKGAAEILKQLKSKNMATQKGYSKNPITSKNIKKTITPQKMPKGGDIRLNSAKSVKAKKK